MYYFFKCIEAEGQFASIKWGYGSIRFYKKGSWVNLLVCIGIVGQFGCINWGFG